MKTVSHGKKHVHDVAGCQCWSNKMWKPFLNFEWHYEQCNQIRASTSFTFVLQKWQFFFFWGGGRVMVLVISDVISESVINRFSNNKLVRSSWNPTTLGAKAHKVFTSGIIKTEEKGWSSDAASSMGKSPTSVQKSAAVMQATGQWKMLFPQHEQLSVVARFGVQRHWELACTSVPLISE